MRHFISIVSTISVPPPAAPPGAESVMVIVSWVSWLVAIAGVVGLMVIGGSMALANSRGQGAPEYAGKLGMAAAGLVIIGAAGGIVTLLLGI